MCTSDCVLDDDDDDDDDDEGCEVDRLRQWPMCPNMNRFTAKFREKYF